MAIGTFMLGKSFFQSSKVHNDKPPKPPKWTVFFKASKQLRLVFQPSSFPMIEIGQCREPPSSGRLCLANLRCLAVLLFLHPPTQRRRPSQIVPSAPSRLDGPARGNPTKIPQVANGENEWFRFFLGGGVGYYTQTSRILWGGFEWRSIATHNQDPTWNIIVENPPQIGGIFWGERLPWQKCLLGDS